MHYRIRPVSVTASIVTQFQDAPAAAGAGEARRSTGFRTGRVVNRQCTF